MRAKVTHQAQKRLATTDPLHTTWLPYLQRPTPRCEQGPMTQEENDTDKILPYRLGSNKSKLGERRD